MSGLTQEELVWAGSACLQSAGSWLPRVACFLRSIYYLKAAVLTPTSLTSTLWSFLLTTELNLAFKYTSLVVSDSVAVILCSENSPLSSNSHFPFLFPSLSPPPPLLYLITRPETAPVSLLPQRDTSFIQLLKQIKQSFPFPWATCSKYKQETNYKGEDKSPLNSWSRAQIWRLIFCLNHRVMPGSSPEQIVPLAPTELTLKCANRVSFPMDYEAIWWRLLIWFTNQHLDITHGKSLKVCLCNARLLGNF